MEGASLDSRVAVDIRRYLPHALTATAIVIVVPALVVIPLSPLEGLPDLLLSALLATGLSVAAGSICSALWTRRPDSGEVAFGDLMLWVWIRRVRAERELDRPIELPGRAGDHVGDVTSDPLLPALARLARIVDARDSHTDGHTRRVTRNAKRIARRMGLPADEIAKIEIAASIHDVGKIGLPRAVLANPGQLTSDERAVLERHAAEGAEMAAELGDPEITAIVRHHHERIDGSGYPDGVAGDEIPLGARIVAVADTFDELTSASDDRRARSSRNALDALSAQAGAELDAAAVSAFLGYYSGTRSIAGVALVATAPQRAVRWLAGTPALLSAGGPPLAQGVCAAGAVAFAGACIAGTPALDRDSADEASQLERPAAVAAAAGQNAGSGASSVGSDGRGDKRAEREGGSRDGSEDGPATGQPEGGGGDAPASTPGGGSPQVSNPGSGAPLPSPSASPPSSPGDGVDVPDLDAPDVPSTPLTPIVDGLVDQVNQTLDPLPTEEILAPVQQILSPLLGKK